jgi:hypothetical protein
MTTAFSCRGCGSERTELVLDLGDVPASDTFPLEHAPLPDQRWPLQLYMCRACALVQLGPAGPAAIDEQGAVESATALAHARRAVAAIVRDERLRAGDTVIEIDSRHGGSWLPGFIDSGLTAREPNATADLVVDLHGMMHEADVDAAVAAHATRIAPGGRLVCEFYYLGALVEGSLIDTVRHGHFSYLSLVAAVRLFDRHGLVVCRAERVPMFGGSLRLTVRRAVDDSDSSAGPSVAELLEVERRAGLDDPPAVAALGRRGRAAATAFRAHLASALERGVPVAGYGAPSRAAVLLALANVDATLLPYTVDLSPAKHGCRIPGAGVPIRPVPDLIVGRPAEIMLLTWDIAAEVMAQLRDLAAGTGWKPRFWAPLPVPGYIVG